MVGGACDVDPERAQVRARAEALERATLIERGPSLLRSREELLERGVHLVATHPDLVDEQWWIEGTQHLGKDELRPAAVPAYTSLLGWTDGRPLRWKQSSVGTAAHPDPDTAATTALLECLERHAVRGVWHGTTSVVGIDAQAQDCLPMELRDQLAAQNLRVRAWRIVGDVPACTVLAAVVRTDREQITFGACARKPGQIPLALLHAVCEAVSVRAALANTSSDPEELAVPRRMARRQGDFLAHLAALEATDPPAAPEEPVDLEHEVHDRFGAGPVVIDLAPGTGPAVIRTVVPHPEFLVPRDSEHDYALSPGYIE